MRKKAYCGIARYLAHRRDDGPIFRGLAAEHVVSHLPGGATSRRASAVLSGGVADLGKPAHRDTPQRA